MMMMMRGVVGEREGEGVLACVGVVEARVDEVDGESGRSRLPFF
jgi:hypothetical protein